MVKIVLGSLLAIAGLGAAGAGVANTLSSAKSCECTSCCSNDGCCCEDDVCLCEKCECSCCDNASHAKASDTAAKSCCSKH